MRRVATAAKKKVWTHPATTGFILFVVFAVGVLALNQRAVITNITQLNRGACAKMTLRECAYALYGALTPGERQKVIVRIDRLERRLGRQIKTVQDLQREVRKERRSPRRSSDGSPQGQAPGGSPDGTTAPGSPQQPAPGSPGAGEPQSPPTSPTQPSKPPGGTPTTNPTKPPPLIDPPSIDLPPIDLPPVDPPLLPLPQINLPNLDLPQLQPELGEGVIICLLC